MALIKCNECGANVSEKSSACMKCGNPMSEILREMKIQKQKKQKKIIFSCITIFLLLVIIAVGVFIYFKIRSSKNPFYLDMDWDSSYESVLEKLKNQYPDETTIIENKDEGNIIVSEHDYLDAKGVDGLISYNFTEDKFTRVMIVITLEDEAEGQDGELIKQYESILTRMYGTKDEKQGDFEEAAWTRDGFSVNITNLIEGLISIEFVSDHDKSDEKSKSDLL